MTTPAPTLSRPRAIAAAAIGNALEFFDLAVYALMSKYIGQAFFPKGDTATETLAAFMVFGVTYLIRPVGGLLLGSYADKHGRTKSLVLTIWLMVLGTFLLAVMPSHAQIGILGTAGMILARLIQGFAAGGEFGAATSFLVEQHETRKAFLGSFQFASQGLSTLLAAAFSAVLTGMLTPEQMVSYGWRIPFVFGMLVGPVGWYIRRHVSDTAEMAASSARVREEGRSPIGEVFVHHWKGLLIAGGALILSTALNFILQYLPTFAINNLGLPASLSFTALVLTGAILMVVTPFSGLLADRVGRVTVMVPAAILIGLAVIPAFWWVTRSPSFGTLAAVMTLLGVAKALYFGPLPSLMSEVFPPEARATGLAFSYNVTTSVFGGFTPAIAASLVAATGSNLAPGQYLLALAVVSLCALFAARHRGVR